MSGRELEADGSDSYHDDHRWEQVGHSLYISPSDRWRGNWPPVAAYPYGPVEQRAWESLPTTPPDGVITKIYGPGFSYEAPPIFGTSA